MHYLDHAATTPMTPGAVAAMRAELDGLGNASSLHAAGRRARRVVEEARERVAVAFGARPSEVVFTSGGTEADNLAVKGLFWARRAADPARVRIVTSAVEHPAVLEPIEWLRRHEAAVVERLPVDRLGRVDPTQLRAVLEHRPDDVALVSVMWANSEVGTVQPVAECAAVAAELGVPFHSDAVQAGAFLPVDFATTPADALTLSGHKLGGPVGVGALLVRRSADPVPLLHGGGQERDLRSGTLATAAIAGFAAAVDGDSVSKAAAAAEVARLRDRLVEGVLAEVPDAILNGDPASQASRRLPGHAHFSFPGCEGDALLMLLDARGIACSTGSACSAGVAQPSHVLLAMGADTQTARASLRFSLGRSSTQDDVDALVAAIGPVVERARAATRAAVGR